VALACSASKSEEGAESSKGSRQNRTCLGGGFWNGERTCVDGEKLRVPGLAGGEVMEWQRDAGAREGWGGEVEGRGGEVREVAAEGPTPLKGAK
jgi:hypothetical protein